MLCVKELKPTSYLYNGALVWSVWCFSMARRVGEACRERGREFFDLTLYCDGGFKGKLKKNMPFVTLKKMNDNLQPDNIFLCLASMVIRDLVMFFIAVHYYVCWTILLLYYIMF
jgi:hypothetical protein